MRFQNRYCLINHTLIYLTTSKPITKWHHQSPLVDGNIKPNFHWQHQKPSSRQQYQKPNSHWQHPKPNSHWQHQKPKLTTQYYFIKAQANYLALFFQKTKANYLAIFYQKPKNINTWQYYIINVLLSAQVLFLASHHFKKYIYIYISKITLQKYYILLKSPKLIIFGKTYFFYKHILLEAQS